MSDSVRDRVLLEALPEIPVSGYSDAALTAAAARAGVSRREMLDAFPKGPASLVEAFSHWADRRMTEAMAAADFERMRDRVTAAVKFRIAAMAPYREAARRAAAFLAMPQNAALAARLSMRSVDLMWRAAGDRSSDFSYYTKRAMLGAVYASTLLYWFSDSSEDSAATWAFLDGRIEEVMGIETLRRAAGAALSKLPNPMDVIAGLRSGRR